MEEPEDFVPNFDTIVLKRIEVLRIADVDGWDNDSKPDVFITLSEPGGAIIGISDTIQDYDLTATPFIEIEEKVITREQWTFRLRVMDFDLDPSLPELLNYNDEISWFTFFPWGEASRFRNGSTAVATGSNCQIRLHYETR